MVQASQGGLPGDMHSFILRKVEAMFGTSLSLMEGNRLGLLVQARWRPVRKVKTVLLGVDQRYQRRRLHDAMILDTYAQLVREQPLLEVGDCSLIPETLDFYIHGLERYGAKRYKTYRIYEREL